MAKVDKAIVTNVAALRSKYGDGFDIGKTLKPLLDSDKRRGLDTQVIDLSDGKAMRAVGGTAVKTPTDPKQNKNAIDSVFKKLRPDYVLILGSIDVVPHQDLQNPTANDGDAGAPGDLPYACEARYSTKAADFRAPTRVVGRLPDATGATKPDVLKAQIATAAKWKQRPRSQYDGYLGVSAQVWQKSTQLSLRNTFGSSSELKLSPASGPKWQKKMLDRRMHFVNCHGAPADPHYYGQRGSDYPVAHDAGYLQGKVAEGTVATAECCYGAELYDPNGGQAGIAATYLQGGAYGFFGSSTIAYGPAEGNGSADLICQYFLQRVLAGASLGRAALEARQRFVRDTNVLDPADLKTLAQFSLIGDPSIHPVRPAPASMAVDGFKSQEGARKARRANLLALGLALEDSRSYAKPRRRPPRKSSQKAVAGLMRKLGIKGAKLTSYDIERPPALAKLGAAALPDAPDSIHALLAPLDSKLPGPQYRLVVATERGGELVSVRDLYSR
jgi:peptidase C25-like protein